MVEPPGEEGCSRAWQSRIGKAPINLHLSSFCHSSCSTNLTLQDQDLLATQRMHEMTNFTKIKHKTQNLRLL